MKGAFTLAIYVAIGITGAPPSVRRKTKQSSCGRRCRSTRRTDPMRELIEDLWPELANKLPPKAN